MLLYTHHFYGPPKNWKFKILKEYYKYLTLDGSQN